MEHFCGTFYPEYPHRFLMIAYRITDVNKYQNGHKFMVPQKRALKFSVEPK